MLLTLKEVQTKQVIISLKEIHLADFNDDDATLEDLAAVIVDNLKDQGPRIINNHNGQLRQGWRREMFEYIDNEFW